MSLVKSANLCETYKNDIIVIMAGGEGKRMNSKLPKVLHLFKNKPMIVHILEKALEINPIKIYIVVGKHKNIIEDTIEKYVDREIMNNKIKFVIQKVALGTGDAIKNFCNNINYLNHINSKVLILSGDVPLVSIDTMKQMLKSDSKANILVSYTENNFGYGRIVQEYHPETNTYTFKKIVEEKDCTEDERLIKVINSGIYCFNCYILCKYIYKIDNRNKQSEYYLTDIFEIIKERDTKNYINVIELNKNKFYEIIGVNTSEQLEELEKIVIRN